MQSTAIALLQIRGILPLPDHVIYSNTGWEPKRVQQHLAWLSREYTKVGRSVQIRSNGNLRDDLMLGQNNTGQRFASIPAFTVNEKGSERVPEEEQLFDLDELETMPVETKGQTRRQCTSEYKIDVIERFIRREVLGLNPGQRIPRDVLVRQIIGISMDEAGRAVGIRQRMRGTRFEPVFPLLDMAMDRAHCEETIRNYGVPHMVAKSSCIGCPYHDDAHWLKMKEETPDEFEDACQVDDALRKPENIMARRHTGKLYLHRSCKPLREVEFKAHENGDNHAELFNRECKGICGV